LGRKENERTFETYTVPEGGTRGKRGNCWGQGKNPKESVSRKLAKGGGWLASNQEKRGKETPTARETAASGHWQ